MGYWNLIGTLMDVWYVPGMAWSEPAAQAGARPQQAAGRRPSRPAAPTPGLHTGAHASSPATRHQASSGRVCPSILLQAQQRQRHRPSTHSCAQARPTCRATSVARTTAARTSTKHVARRPAGRLREPHQWRRRA